MNIPLILLASWLTTTSLSARNPSLEPFTLTASGSAMQDEGDDQCEPGRLFDILGWLMYGAAGNFSASQIYRENESFSYEPTIDNVMARMGVEAAAAEGLNWSSEKLYRNCNVKWAYMERGFGLAAFVYGGSYNWLQGWRGQ